MALADALLALAEDWGRVGARLGPDGLEFVRRELAAAVHGRSWDSGRLLTVLLDDAPPGHPAWRALDLDVSRHTGAPVVELPAAAARLRWVIELSGSATPEPERVTPELAERRAMERIWTVPMRWLNEVVAGPGELVVLHRAHMELVPAFQLDRRGRVLPAVARINLLLDARADPWGAASWWLTPHAALHAIPADELRVGDAERVLAAAAASAELD